MFPINKQRGRYQVSSRFLSLRLWLKLSRRANRPDGGTRISDDSVPCPDEYSMRWFFLGNDTVTGSNFKLEQVEASVWCPSNARGEEGAQKYLNLAYTQLIRKSTVCYTFQYLYLPGIHGVTSRIRESCLRKNGATLCMYYNVILKMKTPEIIYY